MEKRNIKSDFVAGILIGIISGLLILIFLITTKTIVLNDDNIRKNGNKDNTSYEVKDNKDEEENNEENDDKDESLYEDNSKSSSQSNNVKDNNGFSYFLDDVKGSLGSLVVLHGLVPGFKDFRDRKNINYFIWYEDRQSFVMEYILKNPNNEKKFVKIDGFSGQKDDSLDVKHETTLAYYPYNLFNDEYKKLFGEEFKAEDRIVSSGKGNEYDRSKDYVYYINKRAGLNGVYVSDIGVDSTTYNKSDNSYTAVVTMTYSNKLADSLGVESEKGEIIYSIVDNNYILKSFKVK